MDRTSLLTFILVFAVALVAETAGAQEIPPPPSVEVVVEVEVVPDEELASPPPSNPAPAPQAAPQPPIQVVEAEAAPMHAPRVAPPPPVPPRAPRLRRASYQEGMPLPPGTELRERPRIGLAISGGVMLTVSYLVSAVAASDDRYLDLYFPFVGPFVRASRDDLHPIVRPFLVIDGLIQIAGAAMLVAGILTKQRWVEYYAASDDGRRSVAIRPTLGGSNGLALHVDFTGG